MVSVKMDSIPTTLFSREIAMRRILFISLCVFLTVGAASSQIPDLVPGWPYRSQSRHFAVYAIGRIAEERSEKHLFYNTMMGDILKFNLDGSYSNGWPLNCDTLSFAYDPVVLDIDHDGRFEMFTRGTMGSRSFLLLIDDNGTVMPGFPISATDPDGFAAADMDNDNEYEIIYFSRRDGIINCLDRYGNPKPGWPIPFPSDIECVAGSIGDLDLDGNNEYIITGDGHIYAYRFDGTMMPGFPISPPDSDFVFYNEIWGNSLADLDGDGYPEIITAGDNWIHWPPLVDSSFVAIYEHTGQPKSGWPRYFLDAIVSPVTPSDIDNNGSLELAFQSYYLHFIDLNGVDLPGWPVLLTRPTGEIWGSYSDLIIADLNGDGYSEIFPNFNLLFNDSLGHDSLWYYGHSYLFAYDHLGQLLPDYPIVIRGSNFGTPPCLSLDQFTNRFYMSLSTDITAPDFPDSVFLGLYQFPDSTGPPDQWPTLSHDNLHTRNYTFMDRVTSIADAGSPPLPKSVVLKQNYPNPFNAQTTISYSLPKASLVTIDIYDLLGRKLETLINSNQNAGSYSIIWDATERSSGIYFCRIKAGEISINRKMVLVK
jgi:hypothetical protein